MADVIRLLPDSIANQIAAGEVIQRPASVVKELMENSIDAGSTQIKLIIKDAGKTLIQVIDDGCGMSETDARMSFERHATSKIRAAKDLFSIKTMGFRGEAMASIAAIAQVEMKTRKHNEDVGVRLTIEGSEIKSQEPCQCNAGTSLAIKNLFYNVPARRNFLKTTTVEMRHIIDEFQRVALANSDIFFSLHHNGIEVFHLPESNLRQRIVNIFGQNSNKKLVPVLEETDALRLEGFVGKPEFAKKTRGEQFFFVNRRFIKSGYLNHALMGAYEDVLPKDTYPLYVIFIEIDPARIDINVHPTKQEIKFDDERLVYHQEKSAPIMEALRSYLTGLFVHKEREPNSEFGKAANYMLKLWEPLTKFLHVPGAAIDNNLCEQAIKISIRYRKNSLFYKTFHGATIGDSMMSVIQTAKHAGVNIFEYLNTLQEYSEQVKAQPELWLPWNYKDNLGKQIELKEAA